jgi:glycosyltransferase involved in cell wall biosynthesis
MTDLMTATKHESRGPKQHTLTSVSVVLAVLNGAAWMPKTIGYIWDALQEAGINDAEVLVVDDGSSDDTAAVVDGLKGPYPTRALVRPHRGRYLARKAGVEAASKDFVLFVDHRVHLHRESIKFVVQQMDEHPHRLVWNGHIIVAKEGNLIARFGDAITFVGWRRYFGNPHTTSYGLKDFDHYPKGTGHFLVPRTVLLEAMREFEKTTNDLENSSDDTLLIRLIARDHRINLSPSFSSTYYARTTLKGFIKHTYFRGQFFVDGFLRRGTRFFGPLLFFLATCVVLLAGVILNPHLLLVFVPLAVLLWACELVAALALRVPWRDAVSLFALSPIFAMFYGLGIWRAVIRKYVHF